VIEFVKYEITQKLLRSYLPETEQAKALTHIYRSSKLSIEENGANTLYIALGLLKWFETTNSERPRYAPILLLPVEIIRKSAAQGYVIRERDEDTIINITLLEMLRQNFGITISGLDPLPMDENSVNVRLIFSIIRNCIKNQRKWDVEEQAILGIFSFNKFIMWNDIHNNSEKLIENKLVSSLVNGKIEWKIKDDTADAAVLDKKLTPADILLPIGADSSQLESIYEAVNGKSYILHGPPGTGKSQTITNIIANALYRGQRVLFVAEKMAALSVVQNRLKAIGLAPFCLELHSNKTQKSMILAQLKEAVETVKFASPENFRQEATRLHDYRTKLNAYINALHQKYIAGLSMYDAITCYLSIENELEIDFPAYLLDTVSTQTRTDWQDVLDDLVNEAKVSGHPNNHPFNAVYIAEYSEPLKEEVKTIILELSAELSVIMSKMNGILALFDEKLCTEQQINTIVEILKKLLHIPELTPALLTHARLHEILDDYKNVVLHGKERDNFKESILTQFTGDILSFPARQILSEWNVYENRWFIPRYFGQKKIKKQILLYAAGRIKFDVKDILNRIIRFQDEERFVAQYTDLPVLFGRYGKKGNEDWTAVEQIIADTESINALIYQLTGDTDYIAKIKHNLANRLVDGISLFKTRYENDLTFFIRQFSTVVDLENRLRKKLGFAVNYLYQNDREELWIDSAIARLKIWLENINRLKDWRRWLSICSRLDELQLGFVAEKYRQNNIPFEQLQNAFYKGFYHAVVQYIISRKQTLAMFKGRLFNATIAKYKALAANLETLTKKELYAKLAANVPRFAIAAKQSSEMSILQRSIKSNGRGTSIRKLFDQIPSLLSRLCPCMLMSPISVAQYINPDADKFDLIVFDEASQMPTSEAIGAIARGENIVIVGDPKQLPPTSFFSTTSTADEDNIEMEDLESILDDCLALSMPSKHLLWHYRSKHESLIAFSNAQYYDNKLFTFPSPDNIESKVRFVHIEGLYDMGKSRQNKIEAQAVVEEIARRLSDKTLCKKSIGVVTFSSVQQTLIEDMISELFVKNPEIERIAYESNEPLFIKNLENVQGDERDIILFSVGYGPDSSGRVSMNFGPLNRLGGERRLNVAVSRARYEMIVYSSLLPDMIDLNRTSAVGVAGLKYFLEYAQKGKRKMPDPVSNTSPSETIENIIAGELKKQGYEVHTRIGASGYRIDIGIVDSKNPTRYILGILCDGDNYRQAKTARDREIVQYNALRLLGWNIYRIWTMDWWENRQEVLDSIAEEIEKAKTNQNNPPDEPKEPEIVKDNFDIKQNCPVQPAVVPAIVPDDNRRPYVSATLKPAGHQSKTFFFTTNKAFILSQIQEIIETEAPVSRSIVYRKVLSSWDIGKLSRLANGYFEALFLQIPFYRERRTGCPDFFWLNEEQYKSYAIYRPESDRDPLDLPPAEIANGIKQILTEQICLSHSDLAHAATRLFGFSHTGANINAAMYRGINEAIKRNYIKIDNNGKTTIAGNV
jgi:very-short-patch-repair endonuclease